MTLRTTRIVSWFPLSFLFPGFLACAALCASGADTNATANPRPALPDPLTMANGERVTTVEQWNMKRRPELLALFTREMYGRSPGRPANMTFQVFDNEPRALGGKATRKQIAVFFNGQTNGPRMDILLYLPNQSKRPIPTVLGLNFFGNHAISADPAIRLTTGWIERKPGSATNQVNRAAEADRGMDTKRWPLDMILDRGYALATIYRGDINPDYHDGFTNGVQALYPELQGCGDNFSTIAAWAWGASRAMDYLTGDADIDAKHVAVFGWSRLGKTALWAGATDERFAMAFVHESGAGGAKIFRRGIGENITRLNTVFPHWFCGNFRKYNDQDTTLPFDQNLVISLIAPRPVYVASAEQDKWADPAGEFMGAKGADPVYRLFGTEGMPTETWPPVSHPVQGQIGYHIRPGIHDVTDYDWTQYLAFMDKHFGKPAPDSGPRRP